MFWCLYLFEIKLSQKKPLSTEVVSFKEFYSFFTVISLKRRHMLWIFPTIYPNRLEIWTIKRVIGRWWDLTIKFFRTIRIQIFFARFMIARFRLWRWVDRYFRILKSIEFDRRHIILFSAATKISQASSKALWMMKRLVLR